MTHPSRTLPLSVAAGVVGPNPLMQLPGMDRHRDRVDAALTAAVAAEDELMAQMGGHLIEAGGKRARPLFAVASAAVLATPPEAIDAAVTDDVVRSEEHTSELQSLMRMSYAV